MTSAKARQLGDIRRDPPRLIAREAVLKSIVSEDEPNRMISPGDVATDHARPGPAGSSHSRHRSRQLRPDRAKQRRRNPIEPTGEQLSWRVWRSLPQRP